MTFKLTVFPFPSTPRAALWAIKGEKFTPSGPIPIWLRYGYHYHRDLCSVCRDNSSNCLECNRKIAFLGVIYWPSGERSSIMGFPQRQWHRTPRTFSTWRCAPATPKSKSCSRKPGDESRYAASIRRVFVNLDGLVRQPPSNPVALLPED